ncbi:MAG TPA: deoxyribodipyrimidine photolyase, partial [Alphaproteobacteria bacterium]|nr:deoxyribodipyrimidine photolyase [Alphaproteobacteria bacterium]
MGKQIVIIGAGLAGLAAARLLRKEGHNPILLDKGRRIGGRCGTRCSGSHLFN